jgi:hypothetical protein
MTTVANTPYYNSPARYTGSTGTNPANRTTVDDGQPAANKSGRTSVFADSGLAAGESMSRTITFMGKVVDAIMLDGSKLKPINVAELPEDRYQSFVESERSRIEANRHYLENQYTERTFPDYSNDPRMKNYASITIGGKVIATIDNQGGVRTENDAIGEIITRLLKAGLPGEANIPGGPESAQFRAEKIAELLGGRIVKAPTAMSQRQYNAMPPFEGPTVTVDYEGMKNDPLYAQIERWSENLAKTEQKRAEYLVRQEDGGAAS